MTQLIIEDSEYSAVCIGGILSYTTAEELERELTDRLQACHTSELCIDMAQVRFMDSAGLFSLVHVLDRAKPLGKELVLERVPPCVRLVLNITGLNASFTVSEVSLL